MTIRWVVLSTTADRSCETVTVHPVASISSDPVIAPSKEFPESYSVRSSVETAIACDSSVCLASEGKNEAFDWWIAPLRVPMTDPFSRIGTLTRR